MHLATTQYLQVRLR
jgi:hypothetical protein